MDIQNPTISNQEKIAAIIGNLPVLFFLPHLMGQKTEFTLHFMRHGFGLTVATLLVSIIERIPFFGIFEILDLVIFIIFLYLSWNAWNEKKVVVPYLFEYSNKAIVALNLGTWFTPGK